MRRLADITSGGSRSGTGGASDGGSAAFWLAPQARLLVRALPLGGVAGGGGLVQVLGQRAPFAKSPPGEGVSAPHPVATFVARPPGNQPQIGNNRPGRLTARAPSQAKLQLLTPEWRAGGPCHGGNTGSNPVCATTPFAATSLPHPSSRLAGCNHSATQMLGRGWHGVGSAACHQRDRTDGTDRSATGAESGSPAAVSTGQGSRATWSRTGRLPTPRTRSRPVATPPRGAPVSPDSARSAESYAAVRTPWLRPSANLSRADLNPRALSLAARTAKATR